MSDKQIPASPTEISTLADAINEANAAEIEAKRAGKAASRAFTMFCEGHGIPGATFVGITTEGQVIVSLPEQEKAEAPKPELVA